MEYEAESMGREEVERSHRGFRPVGQSLIAIALWARRRRLAVKRFLECLRRERSRCPFSLAGQGCLFGSESNARPLRPLSREFGMERGQPIDRYYIEQFLTLYRGDIRGRVLEIGDRAYTRRFGGKAITRSEVLHVEPGNPRATLVGDLTTGEGVPKDAFDCIILTQTLNFIFDVDAAVRTCYRSLRPGGVVLATVPGIAHISRFDMERWGDYWRFTDKSLVQIFGSVFQPENVRVHHFGNPLTAVSLLLGVVVEELNRQDLEATDPDYQVLLGVRAWKPKQSHG